MIRTSVLPPVAALILAATAGPALGADDGDYDKVLGSVQVGPGEHVDKATTVNGSVEIGANAVVKHAETVNGSVTLGEHSTADSVETVNGSIHIGQGARVAGKVTVVNGHMTLDTGADVGGRLSNVNGTIQLTAAHVGGGIETTNSNLTVGANSRVEGGILYEEANDGWLGWLHIFGNSTSSVPRVVIGPGAIVKGTLKFSREVQLYVSDRATIGPVAGATVTRFSGASP
jgi:UDP-3-O-[3-hydroxymyristoyl] glucosamine N-acyltransferase